MFKLFLQSIIVLFIWIYYIINATLDLILFAIMIVTMIFYYPFFYVYGIILNIATQQQRK
jgi:hypothetical protein